MHYSRVHIRLWLPSIYLARTRNFNDVLKCKSGGWLSGGCGTRHVAVCPPPPPPPGGPGRGGGGGGGTAWSRAPQGYGSRHVCIHTHTYMPYTVSQSSQLERRSLKSTECYRDVKLIPCLWSGGRLSVRQLPSVTVQSLVTVTPCSGCVFVCPQCATTVTTLTIAVAFRGEARTAAPPTTATTHTEGRKERTECVHSSADALTLSQSQWRHQLVTARVKPCDWLSLYSISISVLND